MYLWVAWGLFLCISGWLGACFYVSLGGLGPKNAGLTLLTAYSMYLWVAWIFFLCISGWLGACFYVSLGGLELLGLSWVLPYKGDCLIRGTAL